MVSIGPGIGIGTGITIEATKVDYSSMRNILSASGQTAYDAATSGNFFEVSQTDFDAVELNINNLYTMGAVNRTATGGSWVSGYAYLHSPYELACYAGGQIIGMTAKFAGSVTSGASHQLATGTTYTGSYTTQANALSVAVSGGTNRKFYLRKDAPVEASNVYATVKPVNGSMEAPTPSPMGYFSSALSSWTQYAGGTNQATQFFYVLPATIRTVTSGLKMNLVSNSRVSVLYGSTATWRDISGLGNTPTANVSTHTGTAYPSYYTANGTTTYYNCGSSLLSAGASFTKEAWIYRTTAVGARHMMSSLNAPFWFNGNTLSAGVNGNTSLVTEANVITLLGWIHVAVTWDHATQTMTLYRNGAQTGQTTTSGLTYDAEPIYLAAHMGAGPTYSPTSYFQGRLGEFRIYDRALTSSEITQNYTASRFVMGQ